MLRTTLRSQFTRLWPASSPWFNPAAGPDIPEGIPMATAETTSAPATEPEDESAKDDSLFWDQYIKEADLYDRELVKGLGGDLDALLIFAGLFSAVNTAIIIEAYKDLKPEPAESGGTNALLRTLIHTLDNSTALALPTTFVPPPRAIAVNALFFSSLCCSLFAAFAAVLAKQWLNEYERTGDIRSPHARAHQRHAKFLGMQKYRCEMVMQALGTVLQVSLFLFFLALTNWLWGIHRAIAAVAIVGFAITFAFYFTTTIISIYDVASPFATRLSTFLRELRQSPKSVIKHVATTATEVVIALSEVVGMAVLGVLDEWVGHDGWGRTIGGVGLDRTAVDDDGIIEMDGKCVAWVRDNATMFESIAGMARAAASLPRRVRHAEGLYHTRVGPTLLRSIISSNAIPLGYANGTLFSTVNTIRDAMTSWKGVPIYLACDIFAQLHQMLRLAVPKDHVMSELIALTLEQVDVNIPDHLILRARRSEKQTLMELLQMPTLTLEGRRAALSLLWKYCFRQQYWEDEEEVPDIRDATQSPLEEAWQWKVAAALAGTATSEGGDDKDPGRFEFRVCWAVAFGPSSKGNVGGKELGEDSQLSPVWTKFFQADSFKGYFTRRIRPSFHEHRCFGVAAADLLASSMGTSFYVDPTMLHRLAAASQDPSRTLGAKSLGCNYISSINQDVLVTAFQITGYFSSHAIPIAPLYVWYHLRQWHTRVLLPSSCVNTQYLLSVVCAFLWEQLSESWIPTERVPVTVNAIKAYIDELPANLILPPGFGDHELNRAYSRLHDIRHQRYRYEGHAQDGRQLWDCFVLALGKLFPGQNRLMMGSTVDWAEVRVEPLEFPGSEPDSDQGSPAIIPA